MSVVQLIDRGSIGYTKHTKSKAPLMHSLYTGGSWLDTFYNVPTKMIDDHVHVANYGMIGF